jgi:hypothetical protein
MEARIAEIGGSMHEIGPQHNILYRQEVVRPFFNFVKGAESFYVIGGASMGKTRLLDFLMRDDVQKHYLGEDSGKVWLVRVDLNRLSIHNEPWAFFELLLSSIVLEISNHEVEQDLRVELVDLDAKVIQSHDLLLALRFFEMAVNQLCQVFQYKLCFLFDEFDDAYRSFARETFSQLRAVRDANKNRVSYGVFLRNLPERLRPSPDNESFYELLSRNRLGLGPYSKADTLQIIQQLEARRDYPLTPDQRDWIYEASGGHAGLVQAIFSTLIENPQAIQNVGTPGWIEWLSQQPASLEECRKIWEGLDSDERKGLSMFVEEGYSRVPASTAKLLSAKGLLQSVNNSPYFFSPIFEQHVQSLG